MKKIALLAMAVMQIGHAQDKKTTYDDGKSDDCLIVTKCTLEPVQLTKISANTTNYNTLTISECPVRPGDHVKAGQLLCQYFNKDAIGDLNSQKSRLAVGRVNVKSREVVLAVEKLKMTQARNIFARNALPAFDVKMQELSVQSAEMDLEAAVKNLDLLTAQISLSEALLSLRRIGAPHDGTVIEVKHFVGESVMGGGRNF